MQALLRFLEIVRRELGADDVRGEIGGRDPAEGTIWAMTPGGVRVVAVFESTPADLDDKRVKLKALAESFASLGSIDEHLSRASGHSHSQPPRAGAGHELDDALDVLSQRARASAALVIDDSSPEIWGSSLVPHGPEDVEEALWVTRIGAAVKAAGAELSELVTKEPDQVRAALEGAGDPITLARDVERVREMGARAIDRAHLLAMRAIAAVRESEGGEERDRQRSTEVPMIVREFATIYRLILVFDGPVSELHAEAALIHAMPVIERLVTSLPPRDPVSGGAKVAVLRRLRRV